MHTTGTLLDLDLRGRRDGFDEAELAAVAFLARYSGRTLEAYRHDLRSFFTGPHRQHSKYSLRPAHTSSCTATTWNSEASPRRRSTGGCR